MRLISLNFDLNSFKFANEAFVFLKIGMKLYKNFKSESQPIKLEKNFFFREILI